MDYIIIRSVHSAIGHVIRLLDIYGVSYDTKDVRGQELLKRLHDIDDMLRSWRD